MKLEQDLRLSQNDVDNAEKLLHNTLFRYTSGNQFTDELSSDAYSLSAQKTQHMERMSVLQPLQFALQYCSKNIYLAFNK